MNGFWSLVHEIYTTRETLTKTDVNLRTFRNYELTYEHTNGRKDERKNENYIPVGIKRGCKQLIKTKVNIWSVGLYHMD